MFVESRSFQHNSTHPSSSSGAPATCSAFDSLLYSLFSYSAVRCSGVAPVEEEGDHGCPILLVKYEWNKESSKAECKDCHCSTEHRLNYLAHSLQFIEIQVLRREFKNA